LLLVGIVGIARALDLAVSVVDISDSRNASVAALAIVIAVVCAVGGGLVAVRPGSAGVGLLVQLIGIATTLGAQRLVDVDDTAAVWWSGIWLATLAMPGIVVAGYASRWTRGRATVALAVLVLLGGLGIAAAHVGAASGPGVVVTSPRARASLTPDPAAVDLYRAYAVVSCVAALTLAIDALRRLRRATPRSRPVLVAGALWALATSGALALASLPRLTVFEADRRTYQPWAQSVILHLPLVALMVLVCTVCYVELVRPRLARTASGALVIDDDPLGSVNKRLAWWLGDPSARLVLAPALEPGEDRAATQLTRGGHVLAVIEHDAALASEPATVATGAAAAALAIDAEYHATLAESRVEAARQVGARLLAADAAARGELADALARGPARELRAIAAALRAGEPMDAAARVRAVTGEVRRISHGVLAPELLTGGLRDALPHVAGAPDHRLPASIEVTAYLLARDDPAALLHLDGDRLEIALSSPPGDDLLDRIDALGGSVMGSAVVLTCGAT
jgi:hypothetical protein